MFIASLLSTLSRFSCSSKSAYTLSLAFALTISVSSLSASSTARSVCFLSNIVFSASNSATLTFSFSRAEVLDDFDRLVPFDDLDDTDSLSERWSS